MLMECIVLCGIIQDNSATVMFVKTLQEGEEGSIRYLRESVLGRV
jgi:hypothetical protein